MDSSLTPAEKRSTYRSLLALIKSLENCLTTIDLRNESSASGIITFVDSLMNVTMVDAVFVEYEGDYKYFSSLFLPARLIRDVIIPDDVNITDSIYSMLPSKPAPNVPLHPQRRKMTFKKKRAVKNQIETLGLLRTALESKDQKKVAKENDGNK